MAYFTFRADIPPEHYHNTAPKEPPSYADVRAQLFEQIAKGLGVPESVAAGKPPEPGARQRPKMRDFVLAIQGSHFRVRFYADRVQVMGLFDPHSAEDWPRGGARADLDNACKFAERQIDRNRRICAMRERGHDYQADLAAFARNRVLLHGVTV